MLKLKSLRTQRGDTILEVLIATAVLTLVLTIAYTAANRGTHSIRQAQERGEGSRYTETQIEQLKTYVSRPDTPALPASGTNFCMKDDGTPVTFPAGTTIDTNAQNENFSAFADPSVADCKKDDLYHSYIERNGDTFIAHTRWTRVNGKGIDESTMVHRIFPDLASGAVTVATISPGCLPNNFYNIVGGCTPCPTGYTSPGGFSTSCAPIPAQIQVIVQKIPPDPGPNTPSCANAGVDANGVPVRVNGSGGPYNGTSTALFDVAFSSSYTASITTMPSNFELCSSPPPTNSTPIGTPNTPSGNNQRTMTFKIRPLCYPVTRYTAPYDHYTAPYDHYGAPYDHYQTVYWQQPWTTSFNGYSAGRYRSLPGLVDGSFYWNGPRYDLGYSNTRGWYYELWRNMSGQQYIGTYGDYIGTYGDYLGNYGDPYTVTECPN